MAKTIKVDEWKSFNDIEISKSCPLPSMGGFFQNGMRWKDYIAPLKKEAIVYAEALRKEVIDKGIKMTGEQHQYGEDGVPVFSDGTTWVTSFRAWGDFMAAVWSSEEGVDYCYMDFYM